MPGAGANLKIKPASVSAWVQAAARKQAWFKPDKPPMNHEPQEAVLKWSYSIAGRRIM